MNRQDIERDYWNKAALDPEVDEKYISDIPTEECIRALEIPDNKDQIVLDIGCGVGRILKELPYKGIGIDISKNMVDIATVRDNNPLHEYWVLPAVRLYIERESKDFVYCILVFQHLKSETIKYYMEDIHYALKIGGIFRFQFIEGTEQEPFSNHYLLEDIKQWLEDAGLEFVKADKGLCHSQWTWITARKP